MIKGLLGKTWLLVALQVLVAGVFIYAGVTKVMDPRAFADSIATFRLLPPELINVLALSLPVFEVLVGVLLVVGGWKRQAAFAVFLLSLVFCIAMGQALARGLEVDCGCFGSGAPAAWKTWLTLGRDVLLAGVTWWIYKKYLMFRYEFDKVA